MLRQPGTLESERGAHWIEFLAGKSAPSGMPLLKVSLATVGDAFGYLTIGNTMKQHSEQDLSKSGILRTIEQERNR